MASPPSSSRLVGSHAGAAGVSNLDGIASLETNSVTASMMKSANSLLQLIDEDDLESDPWRTTNPRTSSGPSKPKRSPNSISSIQSPPTLSQPQSQPFISIMPQPPPIAGVPNVAIVSHDFESGLPPGPEVVPSITPARLDFENFETARPPRKGAVAADGQPPRASNPGIARNLLQYISGVVARPTDDESRRPLLQDEVTTETERDEDYTGDSQDRPPNTIIYSYLGESIIVSILSLFCICTLPVGLTAVYYASRVNPHGPRASEIETARHHARLARTLSSIACIGTVLLWIFIFILFLQLFRP